MKRGERGARKDMRKEVDLIIPRHLKMKVVS